MSKLPTDPRSASVGVSGESVETTDVEAPHALRQGAGEVLVLAASVRLTVVLLALGMVLVFVGTLAQSKLGIWVVMEDYFRSIYVLVPVNIFPDLLFPSDDLRYDEGFMIPFPGGFTILGLLTLNMLAALYLFVMRDIKTGGRVLVRRLGLYAIHLGMIILFAGEFVTGLYAKEGLMSVTQGGWSDYVEDIRAAELVLVDASGPETDRQIIFSQAMVERAANSGEPLTHPDLPVSIRVERWVGNSSLLRREGDTTGLRGAALVHRVESVPRAAGIDPAIDFPSAEVTLVSKEGGASLGTWLVTAVPDSVRGQSRMFSAFPQPVELEQTTWQLQLRFARRQLAYRIEVDAVTHETYPGTTIPRNFASEVRVVDETTKASRTAKVWMNHPLRHGGDTYYQHQMSAATGRTTFQVVRNIGALLPYIACAIVSAGMLWHFFVSLLSFSRRVAR